jgi:outer membrane protein assembly factor BamB
VGHSSPVLWGDRIFLLSADPDTAERYVLCLSAVDGHELWRREFEGNPHHLNPRSSFASCTPAVDAEHVYVAWSNPDRTWLVALTHDGDDAWDVDLGPWVSQHGFGTSPMLYEDLVVIQCSQENESKLPDTARPKSSFIVAVDRKTGEERWRTPRKIDTASYSVPCVYTPRGGSPQLLCCTTAEGIFSLDPKTGKQNWGIDVFTMRTVSSPVLAGGLVFGSTGVGAGGNYVVAVRPGPDAEVVYKVPESAPYVPTPVAHGDLIFLWWDNGIVTCLDAATGEKHWSQRVGGSYSGSPVCVGGRIYCISDDGEVVVLAAEKEYRELGRSSLGEPSRSTPAISGGRMYLRTYSHLISLGGKST